MSTRMKKWRKTAALVLCVLATFGVCQNAAAAPVQEESKGSGTISGEDMPGNGGADEGDQNGELFAGASSDISISGVKVNGAKAGGKVEISFTATGNKNRKKNYEVERIERIYPVLNEGFPFAMEDEEFCALFLPVPGEGYVGNGLLSDWFYCCIQQARYRWKYGGVR